MTTQRRLLMIPGPVEVSPAVLSAYSVPPPGHLAPEAVEAFGASLEMMRRVWLASPGSQPFVFAGSGTNAMEMAVANLVQADDKALVVNSGYFSDRIGTMLERHGATVTHLRAEPGALPGVDEVERALASGGFKLMTITHVDTSTAVLAPVKPLRL